MHDAVISTLDVKFVTMPGHKDRSPRGKYAALRKRTAEERMEQIKMLISVGTTYEAGNLQELLTSRQEVMGDELIDVAQIRYMSDQRPYHAEKHQVTSQ